jgi:hypothetical protein
MGSLDWMDAAACRDHLDLPWTQDGGHETRWRVAEMRTVCAGCPVHDACRHHVVETRVVGGFWAGSWRNPETMLRDTRPASPGRRPAA